MTVLKVAADIRVSSKQGHLIRPVVLVGSYQLPRCLKTTTTFGSHPQHSTSPAGGYVGVKKPVLSVAPQK